METNEVDIQASYETLEKELLQMLDKLTRSDADIEAAKTDATGTKNRRDQALETGDLTGFQEAMGAIAAANAKIEKLLAERRRPKFVARLTQIDGEISPLKNAAAQRMEAASDQIRAAQVAKEQAHNWYDRVRSLNQLVGRVRDGIGAAEPDS